MAFKFVPHFHLFGYLITLSKSDWKSPLGFTKAL
uniref:Uncharacterized protein n=1 Tax=Lepeophtheirus salmonis TaxID=72036 RepID=A0A0K2VLX9_LEPSM